MFFPPGLNERNENANANETGTDPVASHLNASGVVHLTMEIPLKHPTTTATSRDVEVTGQEDAVEAPEVESPRRQRTLVTSAAQANTFTSNVPTTSKYCYACCT
jgi:hypothetical protein